MDSNQSNLLLQQSLSQIVNGLGSSFVPSNTNEDLNNQNSQISFLNQSSNQDNSQDSQVRRAITGAHNFNSPITVSRSQTSPQQQSNTALFKQQHSNWPTTATQNPSSAWSTNSQTLLNQPSNQQSQPSLNSWNVFNNTLNSLSNIKQQQQQNQPRLSNLSASSISPLKQTNSQLTGTSSNATTCQQTSQSLLNNTQQLGPLSPKFRNRAPLMNVNAINAMLMMQVNEANKISLFLIINTKVIIYYILT